MTDKVKNCIAGFIAYLITCIPLLFPSEGIFSTIYLIGLCTIGLGIYAILRNIFIK